MSLAQHKNVQLLFVVAILSHTVQVPFFALKLLFLKIIATMQHAENRGNAVSIANLPRDIIIMILIYFDEAQIFKIITTSKFFQSLWYILSYELESDC